MPSVCAAWQHVLHFVQQVQVLTCGTGAAGYLFFKAINSANREAERQDRADGF